MSANSPERESQKRFFTSLVFLVSVTGIAFGLLLFFSPDSKKTPIVVATEKKQVDTESGARRQKMREREAVVSSLPNKPAGTKPDDKNVGVSPVTSGAGESIQSQVDEISQKVAKAIAMIDGGSAKEAQSLLEEVLKLDPKNEQALVELGMIHLIDYHSPNAALPYLEEALKVNGSNKIVLSELVGIYEELGRTEAGLSFLTGLQSTQPNGSLSLAIGQTLAGQGRDSEAIPYLEAAAESVDSDADIVLQDLADAYLASGSPEKAVSTYKKAIDKERLRIQTSADKGDPGDGEFAEDRLNSLEMDYARILIGQGKLEEADEILRRVSSRLPDDGGVTALQEQLNKKRGAG
jgi:tetratricopeptide (TPR) repeat protein